MYVLSFKRTYFVEILNLHFHLSDRAVKDTFHQLDKKPYMSLLLGILIRPVWLLVSHRASNSENTYIDTTPVCGSLVRPDNN